MTLSVLDIILDTIENMRVFAAVARHESFTQGAKESAITVQMASKYVRQLEERLKVQLFNRTTRSVSLNDTGKAYLERCLALLEQFDEVESAVKLENSLLKGRIKLTAPTTFGEKYLVPAIASFQLKNPEIVIDLNLTDRKISLVEEGYDLGIRISSLPDSTMIARNLQPMRVCVCASPDYLQTHGQPQHPEQLAEHNCIIDTNFLKENIWQFKVDGKELQVAVKSNFQANTPEANRQMALAGVGIAKCPMYVINQDIISGKLVILFEAYEAYHFSVYAIYPHRKHLSTRVRGLVDHLATQFRQMG
jgi:DNA-binding transcriptional LysR family regulator